MRGFLACAVLACLLTGCHSSPSTDALSSSQANDTVYHLRGKIVAANPATGEVTIDSQAIPGYMDAMVMPYKLKQPAIIGDLHPGDTITAELLVPRGADGTALLDQIVVIAQAKPDYKPTAFYHVPAPGDPVPDFALRNQDGREIHLDQFRGKELLVTFIYTRCPLPNYCPLVTRNFAAINNALSTDPALYRKIHLLTVSFDPDHDTPARLRAYGAEYVGGGSNAAFLHWDFAVPSKPVLKKMELYFDLGVTYGADGSITHSMSTTLIGPRGKVARFYPGNDWTPQQVIGDMKHLEASAS